MTSALWSSLGYRDNPLFTDPLDVTSASQTLFVGREQELRRLSVAFARRSGGLLPIGGLPGSGKTTFVNHFQYLMLTGQVQKSAPDINIPSAIPCFFPVQMGDRCEPADVVELALISCCRSLVQYAKTIGRAVPDDIQNLYELVIGLSSTWKSAAIDATSAQGGQTDSRPTRASQTESVEKEAVGIEKIRDIVDVAKRYFSKNGIIIVIDNTEILSDGELRRMIEVLRDKLWNIDGIWWVMIGREGLGGMISSRIPRMHGYQPIGNVDIFGLSGPEVQAIVELRNNFLRINPSACFPIPELTIQFTYNSSQGDLRFTFDFLDAALTEYMAEYRTPPEITEDAWLGVAQAQLRRNLDQYRNDQPFQAELVDHIAENQAASINGRQYKKYGYETQEIFNLLLEDIWRSGMLWRQRGPRNEWIYTPKGYLEMERTFRGAASIRS